ncbi:MAG: glucose-6-phosphate dehydrogenase assembly protein OpcA [Rubritalea sp.]|uniref:glucose-6-phosphate dehydrogenase assembly protein OpcA n=1 Tax=Rubritalea sp. TaxID=2109375 RepID=UPI003242E17D
MTVPNDCSQLGREVEIAQIEVELKRLWEADEARTNASLMNFAVYSEDASALAQNSDTVRWITREHACRAILIGVDRAEPKVSMRAWITAHCNLMNGNKSVCSEQIAFHLGGRVSGRLSNTVFAHLNSDLPLIFWWQGELTDRFNGRLYSLIERLVIDSSEWSDPVDQFSRVAPAIQQHNMVVQDLSWTRTYHARLAIASLFDDPISQAAIPSIQKVRVSTSPEGRIAGLQLLAWFAAQCEWRKASELIISETVADSFHFEHKHGGTIEASVVTDNNSAAIGLIEIEAGDVKFTVSRSKGSSVLHVKMEGQGHITEQSAPADSEGVVGLVRDQLSRGGKNSLFRKIFPVFIELMKSSS